MHISVKLQDMVHIQYNGQYNGTRQEERKFTKTIFVLRLIKNKQNIIMNMCYHACLNVIAIDLYTIQSFIETTSHTNTNKTRQ